MARRLALALLAIVALTTSAHADRRDRKTALVLSGVGTGLSSVVILSSAMFAQNGDAANYPMLWAGLATSIVTPSAGEFYAGEYVTPGMAVRIGAVGLATYSIVNERKIVTCNDGSGANCKVFLPNGVAILGLAAIAYVGGAAYDVIDAPDAADRYNNRHGFVIAPTAMATPTGLAPGVYFSAIY